MNLHHLDGDFPVYFFGTKDYFWVNRSKAFLYMDGDDQKKISSHGKHLDKRFKQAMEEVAEAYKQWQKEKEEALQSKTVNPAPYLHLKVIEGFFLLLVFIRWQFNAHRTYLELISN